MREISFRTADELRHAYIVSSFDRAAAFGAAEQIAAAAVCRGTGTLPCGVCAACRKAKSGNHADIRIIGRITDEKGKQKREISVDQIRELSTDAVVLPNESERKVYIIRDADAMNREAQNAALKLLEEPPAGVIFVLCVQSPEALLPTVRSRCVLIALPGNGELPASVFTEQADEYLKLASGTNALELWKWCESHNELTVQETAEFTDCVIRAVTDMLCGRRSSLGMDQGKLMRIERLMEKCSGYLEVNTGVKHVFGLIGTDTLL